MVNSRKMKTRKMKTRKMKTRKNIIGPLKKGELKKCGYATKKTMKLRRKSLKCAVKKYGALSTFRKINVLAILNKNRNPELSQQIIKDRNWIKKTYMKKN